MHLDLIEHVRWKELDHVVPDKHCQVFSCAAQPETSRVLGKVYIHLLATLIGTSTLIREII